MFLTLVLLSILENRKKLNFRRLSFGVLVGATAGFVSVVARAFIMAVFRSSEAVQAVFDSAGAAAVAEEISRYGAGLLILKSDRHLRGLHEVGAAMGFGAGIVEYLLSYWSAPGNAYLELFTAVPILTLLGAAMGYALNAAATLRLQRAYLLAFTAPLAVHYGYNVIGSSIVSRFETWTSFIVVSLIGIGLSGVLCIIMRWYYRRHICGIPPNQ